MSNTVVRRIRASAQAGRIVRVSPQTSKWLEKTAQKRRMNFNAIVDVLLSAFKKMPAEQQAKEFAGGEVEP